MRNQLCAAFAAFTVLTAGAAAQLTPLVDYYQVFGYGLTLGTNAWTNSIGTLRRDPAGFRPQVSDGTNWHAVGDLSDAPFDSVTYGRKDGFWVAVPTNDSTALVKDDPLEGAFLQYDEASDGYVHVYGPRMSILASEAVLLHAATNLGTLYPGQLLTLDIALDGNRHCYVVTNELDTSAFAPEDMTWLPLGAGDVFWKEFVRQGPTGLRGITGDPGDHGLDGVGNIQYGVWDTTKAYLYDTGTPIVVSYAGRWYDCVASSTSKSPVAVGATNYWAVSVDKGADGEIVGWTDLVFRGNWNSGDDYTTNDAVWWWGNLFAVSETNSAPPLGTAPLLRAPSYEGLDTAYWTCLLSRGVQGVKGDDGNEINSYTVYSLFNTNSLFAVYPAASAGYRLPIWQSSDSASTTMVWSAVVPVGTNNLSASSGVLYLNGLEYGRGKTNILELRTEELDADLVLRPDGAGGVRWGDVLAPLNDGIHSRLTAVTNGSGAAYVWPASSAWWRVDADNTITGIVPVVDGAGITGDDLLLLGVEIFREEGADFSWGGGDAPLAGVTNEVPVNEISLHGLWRPSGGTNWVGF